MSRAALAGVALLACQSAASASDLDGYRWQNRPLLVFAPSPDDARLLTMRDRWRDARSGIAERDMIGVALDPLLAFDLDNTEPLPTIDAPRLRASQAVADNAFLVLLIGKDGAVKAQWDAPVSLQRVFEIIDAMPMRRQEMTRDKPAKRP
jgi:hypothetical protein